MTETNNVLVTLGAEIRRKRNLRGLTQVAMAPLVDVTDRTLGKIERGEDNIPFLTLKRITDLLEISLDALFDPADSQEAAEMQDLTELYRACPEDKRPLLLAMVHTLVEQLKALEG